MADVAAGASQSLGRVIKSHLMSGRRRCPDASHVFLSFLLIAFQYEELVHYSGSEGMSVGGYGDDVRPFPPSQYGAAIPDSLKHHKDQIYG